MSWPETKKVIVLKCCLHLFYVKIMNHFSIGLWCVTNSGFYTTTSDDQLSGWIEKKLQSTYPSQTCTKKGHGHCLVVCCRSVLQLSESWKNHFIWEVCSVNWWEALKTAVPTASIGQQNGTNSSLQPCPTTCCTTNASKVEQIGIGTFVSPTIFTCHLPTDYQLTQAVKHLDNFLQWKCFHNQ